MTRLITHALVLAVLCGGSAAALKATASLDSADETAVLQADKALVQAVMKSDKTAVAALLDAEFTATNWAGKTLNRMDVLADLKSLAAASDADIVVHNYGQLMLVTGTHRIPSQNVGVRFLRVWMKRSEGWRALVYQETKIAEKTPAIRQGFGSPNGGRPVDCENPCNTVPYKPETPAQQEIVSMWQAVERTVLSNDVDAWIPNFTDDFIFVTPDGGPPLNKSDRIAMIKDLKRTSTVLIPAKVVSMQVWVIGDAAVMRSEHLPLSGRILHVTRAFVKRGGHWQIIFGQQTALEQPAKARE